MNRGQTAGLIPHPHKARSEIGGEPPPDVREDWARTIADSHAAHALQAFSLLKTGTALISLDLCRLAFPSQERRPDFHVESLRWPNRKSGFPPRELGERAFERAAMPQTDLTYGRFLVFAALAVGAVLVPILLWQLGSILLLSFAAILIAVLLHVVSEPLQKFTPLPLWADLLIAGLILLAAIVSCVFIFGSTISGEFADVMTRIRAGAVQVQDLLRHYPIGRFMLSHLSGANISVTGLFHTVVSTFIAAAEALVVIVMSAAYLAADPSLYRKGLVLLFNPARQEWADETLLSVARALRYWLLGQFAQMALIGVLSTLAVWLIGLPSPLALGLMATMTEFVPYLGPVLAAIPALLVAVTKGPELVVWTLAAYILIHQAEGNLIMPLIQRRMISIPPALMLLGIAGIGALAGLLGFVLAAPIVVAIFVVVQKAYVRDTLKEDVTLAGETPTSSPAGP